MIELKESLVKTSTKSLLYNGKYINPNRLGKGNSKLKNILIFDLPAVKSCLNCSDCKKTCYAMKAQRIYPIVLNFRNENFLMAKTDLNGLGELIRKQLEKSKEKVVRIHSSGDFFSQEYIDFWYNIIKDYTGIKFYAYTKVEKLFDFSKIESLENFNLILSTIDGKLNYGSVKYVNEMKVKYNSFICPATNGFNIKCGLNCNYCVSNKNVVFVEH
jgi:hypothetical protein